MCCFFLYDVSVGGDVGYLTETQRLAKRWTSECCCDMADDSLLSWAYAGVNNTLAGNGGPDCVLAVPPLQRALETLLFTTIGLLEIYVAYPHIRLQATPVVPSTMHRAGRRLLIAFMCLTFGIELGFKFATRQMIWILNPCHIVTMIQVKYTVSPKNLSTFLFFD